MSQNTILLESRLRAEYNHAVQSYRQMVIEALQLNKGVETKLKALLK